MVMKVGEYFLILLNRNFPQEHKLQRIFNKKTGRARYRCTKDHNTNHQQQQ